jgi:hypothetical protein
MLNIIELLLAASMLNELDLKPPVCTLVRIASGRLSNSIAMQHATN